MQNSAVLTHRKIEYLSLAALGYSNQETAKTLLVPENTVKKALETIFDKLEAKGRTNAVMIAFINNILNQDIINKTKEKYKISN